MSASAGHPRVRVDLRESALEAAILLHREERLLLRVDPVLRLRRISSLLFEAACDRRRTLISKFSQKAGCCAALRGRDRLARRRSTHGSD